MDIVLRSAGHFTACQITLRSNKGNNEDDKCWICGEKGHISRDCPKNRNNKKQESNKEEEDEDNVNINSIFVDHAYIVTTNDDDNDTAGSIQHTVTQSQEEEKNKGKNKEQSSDEEDGLNDDSCWCCDRFAGHQRGCIDTLTFTGTRRVRVIEEVEGNDKVVVTHFEKGRVVERKKIEEVEGQKMNEENSCNIDNSNFYGVGVAKRVENEDKAEKEETGREKEVRKNIKEYYKQLDKKIWVEETRARSEQ